MKKATKPKAAKVTGQRVKTKPSIKIKGPANKARKDSAKQAAPDTIHLGHNPSSLLT